MSDMAFDNKRYDLFVRLLTAHHNHIHAYIYTMVPVWADAEDLMQEVSSVLFNKFDQFEEGTSFIAWAKTIANYRILNFRKKQGRSHIQFSDEAVNAIAEYSESIDTLTDSRLKALNGCIEKLADNDRKLILSRYKEGGSTKETASYFGVSIHSIYRSIDRIHKLLQRCILRTLANEERGM